MAKTFRMWCGWLPMREGAGKDAGATGSPRVASMAALLARLGGKDGGVAGSPGVTDGGVRFLNEGLALVAPASLLAVFLFGG